uniref:Uncharacterized protein n=1 Tax=Nelumbo nucifera TaxID=4432 RepID=A0A822ZHP6_NELNU|nr:TPA_asm: hypothetical protein HUJ06_002270 [Nelumbo nucifera]
MELLVFIFFDFEVNQTYCAKAKKIEPECMLEYFSAVSIFSPSQW